VWGCGEPTRWRHTVARRREIGALAQLKESEVLAGIVDVLEIYRAHGRVHGLALC
jgi:hypothetical protein